MGRLVNELSLFTGGGGGVWASKLLGHRVVGYVEWEPYCQRIIAQRIEDGIFDDAPIIDDVRCLDKETVDNIASLCYESDKIMEDKSMGAHRKEYDEAVRMYEVGLSIGDVAAFYGITRQAMHKILKRRGVEFRNNLRYGGENHFYRGGVRASGVAHDILESAIKKGVVVRKTHCEKCGCVGEFEDGRTKIQAHHSDYNKPIDVVWLCQKCHHEWHKENKAVERKQRVKVEAGDVIDVISAGFP